MLKRLIRKLRKRSDYNYPTAALCIDSCISSDIIKRAEDLVRKEGYIAMKVIDFNRVHDEEDEYGIMYDKMNMQVISNADFVFGISVIENGEFSTPKLVSTALVHAKSIGKPVEVLAFT